MLARFEPNDRCLLALIQVGSTEGLNRLLISSSRLRFSQKKGTFIGTKCVIRLLVMLT